VERSIGAIEREVRRYFANAHAADGSGVMVAREVRLRPVVAVGLELTGDE